MGKFFERSMEIIKGGIAESTSDYTANLRSLKNDADSIRTSIMEEGKTAKEAYTKMKGKNLHKTLLEWFYTKGDENESYGDLDYGNDDEFDAGFGDMDDGDEPEVSPSISVDSMKGIARGQLGAMYNIAGKQTEASMANTAEVVSTFNTRSSEIIASIGKIESSLNNISQKMDTLIKVIDTSGSKKSNSYGEKDSLYDIDGMLNPLNVFNHLKRGIKEDSMLGVGAGFLKSGLSMGGFTPESLLAMGLSNVYEKQRFSFLGNKTIDEVGNKFNDTVKSITHNALAEFLDSKPMQFLMDTLGVDNPMYGYGERDYSKLRKNEFNTKPATFDGLTRHSIIHTIPEYLKNIHNALTGKNLVVDQKGNLTDSPKDNFSQVTRKAFADGGLDYGVDFTIASEARSGMPDVSASDVNEASKVLTMIYVMYLYQSGNTMLKTSQISSTDVNVINRAVKTLMSASGKSQEYWSNICLLILHRLETNMNEATKFAANVNVRLRSMDEEAEKLASSSAYFSDLGKLNYDMAEKEYVSKYKERQNAYDDTDEAKTSSSSGVGNGSKNRSNFTMLDYTRGIFNVLKRGINVKVTNKPNDYSGYKPFKLTHVEPVADVQEQVDVIVDTINVNKGDGLTYMERMLAAIMPKSAFRLAGMQHFAERHKGNSDAESDNGEPSMWDDYSDTKAGKAANVANNAIDKVKGVGKKIFGERVAEVGEDGKTRYHREGGAINNVGGFIYEKAANIGGGIAGKIQEEIEYRRAKNIMDDTKIKLDKMNPANDVEKEDQQKAQMVLSMMNASAVDGDTEADLSDISNIIQQISDPKLKARLQASVMPLLRRSGKKKSGGGLIGKIFGLGFAAVKLLLTPLLKTIGAAVTGLKAVGSRLVHAAQRYVKNSVIDLRVGMSNIFRSMFGRKMKTDASGNVIQESEEGLIQILFKKHFDKLNTGFKSFSTKLSGILDSATKGLNTVRNKMSAGMDKLFKKAGEMGNSAMNWVSNKYFDSKMKKTEAKDLSGRSEFMKGFLGVFEESKKAKREALLKSKKPETYADVKAGEIRKDVAEVSNTMKDSKSILSQIRDKLDAIINKGDKSKPETIPKKLSEEEINKSVRGYWGVKQNIDLNNMLTGNTGTPSPAMAVPGGGASASVSFSIANTKGTNPTNVVPNTIPQSTAQPTTTDINTASGSGSGDKSGSEKAGSKVGKTLGAIGKGVGGLVSIGSFILKILGPTLASMGGLNSLMSTVSKTLKVIAKPVNSMFKVINKTMKPLFKKIAPMIQNILSIVGGLITDLMPVVTTIADLTLSLLPALTPVIKAVTTVLTPVIQVLNGLLETVVVPAIQVVAGAVTGLLGGILWLGGTFATAIGKLIPGKAGDKVEQTGIGVKKAGTDTLKEAGNLFKSAFSTIVNKVNSVMSGSDSVDVEKEKTDSFTTADVNSDGKVDESDVETFKKENLGFWDMVWGVSNPWSLAKKTEETEDFIRAYGESTDNKELANYKLNSVSKSDTEIIAETMTDHMSGAANNVYSALGMVNDNLEQQRIETEKQNERLNKYMDFDEDATKKGSLPFFAKLSVGLLPAIAKVSGTNSGIMGAIMIAGGAILSALGLLPGAGSFSETGSQLYTEGKNKLVESATAGDFTKTNVPSLPKTHTDLTEYANRQTGGQNEYSSGKLNVVTHDGTLSNQTSVLDNQGIYYYGSYDDLLGSGDVSQKSFGSFMNMNKRGCGPVALAEAYARRTGSRINPAQLAKGMARTGAYSPDAGTSVHGFIDTGEYMGMSMRAAGVTESSLRSASPNNPITVFGSGPAYGTRKGNNHFMNVIGSDGMGNGYVSNPLTGKTSKRSLMSIVRNSKLGLYGSGDEAVEEATSQIADVKSAMDLSNIADIDSIISDDTKTAFADLKDLANKILDIFKMDDGDASNILDEETAKAQYEQNISVLTDEQRASLETDAYELFKADNPQKGGDPGETDEEYNQRWLRNKDKYMLIASNSKAKEYFTNRASSTQLLTEKMSQSYDSALISGGVSSGSGGTISSKSGAKLGTPYTVTITSPNVKPTETAGRLTETPVHEFFKNTAQSDAAWSVNGNFFSYRENPNRYGVGSSGLSGHRGIDILVTGGETNKKPMVATTDGVVTQVVGGIYRDGGENDGDGFGNHVKWRDVAGNTHIYAHMHNPIPAVKVGDEIIGGKTLMGFMGSTGHSSGHHLHYEIRDKSYNPLNPIEYFSIYTPPTNSSSTNLGNGSDEDKIFRYLISNGANKIAASGFMGVWEHESDNNPSRLEGDYDMGGVNSTRVMNAFKSQAAMNQYTKDMVQKVYGGWGTLSHSTYCPDGTNYYPGVGLAQWTGTRTQSLAKKAKERGTQWNDLGTQLELWKDEVNSGWSSSLSGANKAGSPSAAAEVVLNRFEGVSSSNRYAVLSERQRFANQFYDRYKNMDPSQATIDATNASNLATIIENSDGTYTITQGNTTAKTRDGYSRDHLEGLLGSGDEYTLDDLLNVNRFNDTFDSSLIDTSIPASDNGQPTIVNRYFINNETKNDERLKAILSNTYNVRARKVEELLEQIIEKMDDNDSNPKPTSGGTGTKNNGSSNMFDENGIPKALQRLYTE